MDENTVLGVFTKIMAECPVHRRYLFSDANTMLLPAIRHGHYKFFEGGGQYGAVTWALLNEETSKKHIENKIPLSHEEWKSGNQFWIISLIGKNISPAPLISSLASSLSASKVQYLRRNSDFSVRKIVSLERRGGKVFVENHLL